MLQGKKRFVILLMIGIVLARSGALRAQSTDIRQSQTSMRSLEDKLSLKATFIPRSKSALAQLIEVAKHYRLPMGIEWLNRPGKEKVAVTLSLVRDSVTVRELIQTILLQSQDQQMSIEDGIIHITHPAFMIDPKNLLNLRISEIHVENLDLPEAEAQLRLKIGMTLRPQLYTDGYGVGHRYYLKGAFSKRNISISGNNLTVREILNDIAKANGSLLWVAQLTPRELADGKPSGPQNPDPLVESKPEPIDYPWQFISFEESD
jgi:hypothetical protein